MLLEIVSVVCAVALAVTFTGDGENEQVVPAGSPEHARVTVPANPLLGARLSVAVELCPRVTVKVPLEELSAKLPPVVVVDTVEIEPNRPSFSPFRPAEK